MIPYNMYSSINLGPIVIFSWGLIVAIAFIVGTYLAIKEGKRRDINKEHIYGFITFLIIGGIVGSRLLHVISNWNLYSTNLLSIFKLWEGGLDFSGGLILSIVLTYVYVRKNKLNYWVMCDILAPSIVIGHAIGRVGCIVGDGGHLGKTTSLAIGASSHGQVMHLTSLYSFFYLTIIFLLLIWLRNRYKSFDGFIFFSYVTIYSLIRFLADFLRTDPTYYRLTIAQHISLIFFLCFGNALYLRIKTHKLKKRK